MLSKAALLSALALALAACGGTDSGSDTSSSPPADTSGGASSSSPDNDCLKVSRAMVNGLNEGLQHGVKITRAAAVKAQGFHNVYFIAGKLKGPGVDDTGVWATNHGLKPGDGLIFSVDGMAREFSVWPDADVPIFSADASDPNVDRALECL